MNALYSDLLQEEVCQAISILNNYNGFGKVIKVTKRYAPQNNPPPEHHPAPPQQPVQPNRRRRRNWYGKVLKGQRPPAFVNQFPVQLQACIF